MKYRDYLPFMIFLLFCVSAGFADTDPERGDFWLCPSLEAAFYNSSGTPEGVGLALGYGSGISIGMKMVWFLPRFEEIISDDVSVLEINFLVRFYFSGKKAYSGAFLQFFGGPALFFCRENGFSVPSDIGAFSIGMGFGWRFLIKEKWIIEPYIRGGYPYLAGAGLSAGIRF